MTSYVGIFHNPVLLLCCTTFHHRICVLFLSTVVDTVLYDSAILSESESHMYSATINEDYYAEAGVVSKGSVHHVIERVGSGKMKSKR